MNLFVYLISESLNREKSRSSRELLLEANDLPGNDWKVIGKRTWRTGTKGSKGEASQRARQAGSFTAWRQLEQTVPARRSIWLEVIPYVSADDAISVVPSLRAGMLPNPHAEVKVIEEREINDQQINGVTNQLVFEQLASGRKGSSVGRYVIASVENTVFVMGCSCYGDYWPWSDVTSIAALQSERIQRYRSSGD
jgi:hypothetical protein